LHCFDSTKRFLVVGISAL
jgi:hypothetical protein